jgi:hypothetical protein
MKYAIEILQNSARGIGLPERQYVWFGGNGVDSDGDGHIGDNPATPAIVEGAGEKEIPWCFEFGEKEWKAGKVEYSDAKDQTERFINSRNKSDDKNYRADCL